MTLSDFDKRMQQARKQAGRGNYQQAAIECDKAFQAVRGGDKQLVFQAKLSAGIYYRQAGSKCFEYAIRRLDNAMDNAQTGLDRHRVEREQALAYLSEPDIDRLAIKRLCEQALDGCQKQLDSTDDSAMVKREIGLCHYALAKTYTAIASRDQADAKLSRTTSQRQAWYHYQEADQLLSAYDPIIALSNLYDWTASLDRPQRTFKAIRGASLASWYIRPMWLIKFMDLALIQPIRR